MKVPHFFRTGTISRITLCLGISLGAMLAGCVVTSVYPFYMEKDLTSDPALLGDWLREIKDSPDEIWKFEKLREKSYRLTLIEERHATVLEAHLFKLQGQLFLELASMEQDYHVIPPHYLLKVRQLTPALRMSELNYQWVQEVVVKDPGALRHHFARTGDKPEDRRLILTASTAELQKFVIQHLETADAWKDSFDLKRLSR